MQTIQSALHPAGVQAAHIAGLWWVMFWICTAVFLAVVLATVAGVVRGRSEKPRPSEGSLRTNVAAAVGVSVAALLGILVGSELTGRALASLRDAQPLTIQVTGFQWWWSVVYQEGAATDHVITANELHLPVGRTVAIALQSQDVIHSFWVPNLHGKTDLVPGRLNTIWVKADRPGIFRGQCAEFCGLQHAHMALTVVAEPVESFEKWRQAQRSNAPEPTTPEQQRGREIVVHGPCALCHAVRGTTAGATTAPDLTHVATRSTLAAGTLPNTPDRLALWISDPQHVKPGSRMPPTELNAQQLQDIVSYLETLR
jgi:cytochrome c oxidase subunit 2